MTKVKVSLALVAMFAALAFAANAGAFGKGEKQRNCGAGIRPRTVAAHALWTGGQVSISGNLGPSAFAKARAQSSPYKAAGQACPGETISINVRAIRGPLPSIICKLWTGGHQLTGDSIHHVNVPGQRAFCEAIIQ